MIAIPSFIMELFVVRESQKRSGIFSFCFGDSELIIPLGG